jgi:NAD(P)-dependent dehydrogenase (short-subunit alcohol dehydrogenase family)
MTEVVVVTGAGSIGQAIARRVGAGRHVLLATRREESAGAAGQAFRDAGFETSTAAVDVSNRESVVSLVRKAISLGPVTRLIHAAGVSPSQASPETILRVDLCGTALVLEEFGGVIAAGGSGVVIASQSGHQLAALTAEQERQLATTPARDLLALPMLQPGLLSDSLHAYQLAKRGNSLRVRAEAVRWAERDARINAISPGIIITAMARDEMKGPGGQEYRALIVATVGALLLGTDGAFITGSDVLMDGGLTAAYFFGAAAPS